MVERLPADLEFDAVFQVRVHPIRRAILDQVADESRSVSELAEPHDVSLAAVSKHDHVREDAGQVDTETQARVRRCHFDAAPPSAAFGWLTRYRVFWEDRFDALADHLEVDEA